MRPSNKNKKIEDIIKIASEIAEKTGVDNVTFSLLSKKLGVTRNTFYHYFSSLNELKQLIIERALSEDNLCILSHCIFFDKIDVSIIDKKIRERMLKLFKEKVLLWIL